MGDRAVIERVNYGAAPPYHKGGRISGKRGKAKLIKVHTGEVVLPRKEVKNLEKLLHNKRKPIKRSKKK